MNKDSQQQLAQLRISAQSIVDLIYDTLECLHQVLTEAHIRYTIIGGTALGAQRHGGLIPWDDDADTAILVDDEQRLLSLQDLFAKRGYTLAPAAFVGYRLHHTTLSQPRVADQARCPFVDIFLLRDTGSTYEYVNDDARVAWPQNPLPYGAFDRITNVPFGHLIVRGLCSEDMKSHLDENYGKDWSTVAWREWDHFFYENVPDIHVPLNDEKTRRPARHSKVQRPMALLQHSLNSHAL